MTEDQFKPLRLMNGLYLQLHAYMLRIAIPYGTLTPTQLRKLAHIARTYDKGYGHFTTRQNMQFNWIKLEDAPDILAELAEVEMHAIQTSGNCIRNVTADHFAGAAADEIDDPRVWCRDHPPVVDLPPGILLPAAQVQDRGHRRAEGPRGGPLHDIGLQLQRERGGRARLRGHGRRRPGPHAADRPRPSASSCRREDCSRYLEAILRVYNRHGRRDNIYKARIKILVARAGRRGVRAQVEEEWRADRRRRIDLPDAELDRIRGRFAPPAFETLPAASRELRARPRPRPRFRPLGRAATSQPHKAPGYAIVDVSLKPHRRHARRRHGRADGRRRRSGRALQLRRDPRHARAEPGAAACAQATTCRRVWRELGAARPRARRTSAWSATSSPARGSTTARSPTPARSRSRSTSPSASPTPTRQRDIGELKIKITGCINACGHHHVGHIGILGVDKNGEEFYQLTLGGSADDKAALGEIIGPAFSSERVVWAVETIVDTYLELRRGPEERFLDAYRRVGPEPFKENLYAPH